MESRYGWTKLQLSHTNMAKACMLGESFPDGKFKSFRQRCKLMFKTKWLLIPLFTKEGLGEIVLNNAYPNIATFYKYVSNY